MDEATHELQPGDPLGPESPPFEAVMVAGIQELFQRIFFMESIVAEVVGILAEDLAKQPHHAADRLRELLDEPANPHAPETQEEG